uniref:Endoplasmic reticulum lectin 1 n=1 Tax=Plectus sambesii TaxID=2011161 RepID=A0A914WBL5_9BILA
MAVTVGLLICLLLIQYERVAADFKEFDDTVLFKLSWQHEAPALEAALKQYREHGPSTLLDSDAVVLISTGSDEKYLCSLPKAPDGDKPKVQSYHGPTPGELMAPLYNQRSCTYRMEMYWTYELCHGRFLMQYHEEKDPVKGKLLRTEYYLGQFMSDRTAEEDAAFD